MTPKLNPGHIGRRRTLSPMRHPSSPKWVPFYALESFTFWFAELD